MKKRGISPLIATVLVIGFTIILGGVVATWLSGVFNTQINSEECNLKGQEFCSNINNLIEISAAANNDDSFINLAWLGTQNNKPDLIKIEFKNDQGETEVIKSLIDFNPNNIAIIQNLGGGDNSVVKVTVNYDPSDEVPGQTCYPISCPSIQKNIVHDPSIIIPDETGTQEGEEPPITGDEYLGGALLGRVTQTSAALNLINRDETENYDLQIQYYPQGDEASSEYTSTETVTPGNTFTFDLINLETSTLWSYKIHHKKPSDPETLIGPERTFHTQRNLNDEIFNFALIADQHIISDTDYKFSDCQTIVNLLGEKNIDFTIALGDNIASDLPVLDSNYMAFRKCIDPVHNEIPLYSVIGNHEGENGWYDPSDIANSIAIRKKFIPNPSSTTYPQGGNSVDGNNEDYYAFTWGDSLFVILNVQTYTTEYHEYVGDGSPDTWMLGLGPSRQRSWLSDVLSTSTEKWKFIFIHHSVGGNGADLENSAYGRGGGRAAYVGGQNAVHNFMIDNGVQALFYGHDHTFFDMTLDGIHYTSISNQRIFDFTPVSGYDNMNLPSWFNTYGYSYVEVKTNEVVVHFVDKDTGSNIYSYTITPKTTDITAPEITHTPVTANPPGQDIIIDATITDAGGSGLNEGATYLYYKPASGEIWDYNITKMNSLGSDQYQASIPAATADNNFIYYIHTEDNNGNSANTLEQEIYYEVTLTNNDVPDQIIYDGHVTETGIKTDNLATMRIGNPLGTRYRGFIDFDTTSIPDNAIIKGVDLEIYRTVDNGNTAIHITGGLVDRAQTYLNWVTLFNDLGNAPYYAISYPTPSTPPAPNSYTIPLNPTTAPTDLQAKLIFNWFSLGIVGNEGLGNDARFATEDGELSIRPKLIVRYAIN